MSGSGLPVLEFGGGPMPGTHGLTQAVGPGDLKIIVQERKLHEGR